MYNYDLWYDGCLIHSELTDFETEEEAMEDAEMEIENRCSYWDIDGVEYNKNGFDIDIQEVDTFEDDII